MLAQTNESVLLTRTAARQGFLARLPLAVYVVAVFAALLQIAPYWRAAAQTPPGWTFTGNLSNSPDNMQYRVWTRQTWDTGPLVDNKFTTEPNRPHLLVLFYYAIGGIARLTNLAPEWVYAYAGSALAFLFTILVFATIRQFLRSSYQTWWVFAITLLGGGLGGHLKILSDYNIFRNNAIIRRLLLETLWTYPNVFESYRGNYIIKTLFDAHFLVIWLFTTAAVVSLYFTLRNFSLPRLILTVGLYTFVSLLHIYEGITLLAITAAIVFLLWVKKQELKTAYITLAACTAFVVASMLLFLLLYRASGIPFPDWRGSNVIFAYLAIAYPVAWLLLALGLGKYWREASFDETFLLGWILGCVALILSGPFYPYPDRGTMTLQIPLYIVAGAIFFSRWKKVSWPAVAVVVLLLGATPAWIIKDRWVYTAFNPDLSFMYLNSGNQEIIEQLRSRATSQDVLITDPARPPWENDLLWLAPEFPGKFYCGHFFLTVDYDRKCGEVSNFYNGTPDQQAKFLQETGIRFVFVEAGKDLSSFNRVPGLILAKTTTAGSLYEYQPQVLSATQ